MKTLANNTLVLIAAIVFSTLQIKSFAGDTDEVGYSVGIIANASSGRMSPYMIGSWNGGRTTMKNSAVVDIAAEKKMSPDGRFSWGAGVELMTGYSHDTDYAFYDATANDWTSRSMRPAAISLRTLYAEAHYRCLYAQVGMKDFSSKIVDGRLSSGDLVRSNNARAIPGVTIGFVDFQNIPFTNGWLQIDGQIMYGKLMDNDFRRKQFNYYNGLIATDLYYTYKYCYFRTKPSERFSATFGMQTAGQFGGQNQYYVRGAVSSSYERGFRFKDIFKMFFPMQGNGNSFYEGNSLGSWSLRARYRLSDESEIAVYWEKFFEDGSGIGCRTGLDGLYGLQYTLSDKGWFNSVVLEYLDFRNQSGPLHWAPGDMDNTTITSEATGGDNYYNNDTFGPYTNYGMSIGSPMVMSPIYNVNGYPEYIYNRMRGFHVAALGYPTGTLAYKLMAGWQKGYANGRIPLPHAKSSFSAMAALDWDADRIAKGFSVGCKLAFDRGELRGDNFGAMLTFSYRGSLDLKK